MKHVYIEFWRTNGNVAALWHIAIGMFLFGVVAMIWYGNRCDRQRDREYRENTDRHI